MFHSYEGDEQVKRAKLQTLRIQYENLRMHNDESVANYFLFQIQIIYTTSVNQNRVYTQLRIRKPVYAMQTYNLIYLTDVDH